MCSNCAQTRSRTASRGKSRRGQQFRRLANAEPPRSFSSSSQLQRPVAAPGCCVRLLRPVAASGCSVQLQRPVAAPNSSCRFEFLDGVFSRVVYLEFSVFAVAVLGRRDALHTRLFRGSVSSAELSALAEPACLTLLSDNALFLKPSSLVNVDLVN
jgi:hypothetical protein